VLEALEHCHAKGVVHRDIKPANIMLDESGPRPVVKVMDFGIARLLSEEATRLTSTGMLIGTPAYLSPEQADGKLVLPASDLYSLGCVLYELLTGRPPFAGETPSGVLMGHLLRTPQAPSALRPGLSAQWDQAVLTALAKDPQDRYTNAADMRAALLNALEPTAASMAAARDRLAVPAQRVPPGGELPRTLPSPAGTVSIGLPATLSDDGVDYGRPWDTTCHLVSVFPGHERDRGRGRARRWPDHEPHPVRRGPAGSSGHHRPAHDPSGEQGQPVDRAAEDQIDKTKRHGRQECPTPDTASAQFTKPSRVMASFTHSGGHDAPMSDDRSSTAS
jgi:serine/threonine protein kinase